jgi:FecR protein
MKLPEGQAPSLGPRAADTVEAVRRHFGHMSERQRDAIFSGVRSRMIDGLAPRRSPRALRWSGAVLAGAAVVAVGLFVRHRGRGETISFRVEGAELLPGGSVAAGPSGRPVVRFSDGSEVILVEGSRVHVRTVDEHGARVTLDEGEAHAYVVHTPATHWSFDVGPYVVDVTGTAFGISWAAAAGQLDLRLENGSVRVSGPVFDTPVALRAGQWLTVRARDVLIRDLVSSTADSARGAAADAAADLRDDPPGRGSEGADAPAGSSGSAIAIGAGPGDPAEGERSPGMAPARRAARHRAASAARASSHGWAAELEAGKFAAIVDEALRLGLDASFSESRGDDLAALADAARYTRHYDLARGALLAQRQRFAASERARVAAFSLGRLSEAEHDDRGALSWFETYLTEAPEGTYAPEALGRKMLLVEHLDGSDAARPLASAYLRSFPNGTYAQAARALAPSP